MSSTPVSESATGTPRAGTADMKLEVVVIPVSDVDRAKEFYVGLGWRLDVDADTALASSSSRRPAPAARSSSARTSRPPRPARPRACT